MKRARPLAMAAASASLGLALLSNPAPAMAATIGTVRIETGMSLCTNSPSMWSCHWALAWKQCYRNNNATKSVEMFNWYLLPSLQIAGSEWKCRDTP